MFFQLLFVFIIFRGNEDCEQKKAFFCSVRQENTPKCPPNYFSFKEMCIYKNSNKTSFSESKEQCGQYGGIVLPIKTKGLFEFIKSHANALNSGSLYIGMNRTDGLTRFTDFSEYNSSSFDLNGSDLVTENLQCVFLDSSDGFVAKQTDCENQFESYCLWQGKIKFILSFLSYNIGNSYCFPFYVSKLSSLGQTFIFYFDLF